MCFSTRNRSQRTSTMRINTHRYGPHNDLSVNDGPHVWRWCDKIIILLYSMFVCLFVTGARAPLGHGLLIREVSHTQRRTTVGRTPLGEWSARHRDLYLTTHNTHNRQTSMPPVGFEPPISSGERPQTARPLGPTLLYNIYNIIIYRIIYYNNILLI